MMKFRGKRPPNPHISTPLSCATPLLARTFSHNFRHHKPTPLFSVPGIEIPRSIVGKIISIIGEFMSITEKNKSIIRNRIPGSPPPLGRIRLRLAQENSPHGFVRRRIRRFAPRTSGTIPRLPLQHNTKSGDMPKLAHLRLSNKL